MKKKAIIITSVIVAAIVCVVIVLCVIRSKQTYKTPAGDLPIISDDGVSDIIIADSTGTDPSLTGEQQTEITDSGDVYDLPGTS